MNELQKIKYQLLKEKNQTKIKEFGWKNNILYQECVTALGESDVLTMEETDRITELVQQNFLFNLGSIDWKRFRDGVEIKQEELVHRFNRNDSYYILWDCGELPFVKANFERILKALDDVLAVSFNTWLLSVDGKEIIEFHHEGIIRYGSRI